MKKEDFLIEVYTEELPPSCIEEIKNQSGELLNDIFNKNRVDYKTFKIYVTPVRIVIYVESVNEFTKKEIQEIIGPSINVGIKNGEFTLAAIGFAKKYNVELKDLFIKETEKGKFLCIKKFLGGESFKKSIENIFNDYIKSIKFPKTMVWEDTKFKFPRPIRNILVIYGDEIIKIKFSSIVSTNFTFGIKTHPIKRLKIDSHKDISKVDSYFELIKRECIILDDKKRLELLLKSIESITLRKKLKYENEPKFINEIISIIEYPSCVLCEFPEEFLRLPEEFVITCMKTKQKFIPLYDEKNKIVNKFIGVKNGDSEHLKYTKNGFEKVLIARLNDVKYYYETDKNKMYIDYLENLKGIMYNEKLSLTYYDRSLNIGKLAQFLNENLNFKLNKGIIELTSKLIKNDLTTQIVFEYPELIGVAGKIYCLEYCKKNNLPEEIAECCLEHYKPKNFDDKIPNNDLYIIFSLADKISNIIDQAFVDNLPSGNSDPLGLKKLADAAIKICLEKKINLELNGLINYYLSSVVQQKNIENFNTKIISFFSQRYENILLDKEFKIDEIRSVLYDFNGDFFTKLLILETIKKYRKLNEFVKLIELYKRVYNILIQAKNKKIEGIEKEVEKNLFVKDLEENFFNKLLELKGSIDNLFLENEFEKILKLLIDFKPWVDNFFDKILIFDENKEISLNRLRLLNLLLNVFTKIAHLNFIQL
ncbi:MAG: glycine--tRNA ligase subunit beta [Endomicrobia bacterium]|nr:glycine--tRNA ligase subunit beta [Endomicrobiia bacterium]